ncbi:hypothetical protein ACLMNJ_27425 [Streptomyces seoulensis]
MTTPPRSPRLLMLSTAILTATGGIALLGMPHRQQAPSPAPSSTRAAAQPSSAAAPSVSQPDTPTELTAASGASTPLALASALPPHGEGVAADQAVQHSLEAAWPADLPAADERTLLAAGRALLHADATGVGRAHWPDVFPHSDRAMAPAFATARFRMQAAVARRGTSPDQAMVHLVWAGIDRAGTFTDLRITDWHFTRTTPKRGAARWIPYSAW